MLFLYMEQNNELNSILSLMVDSEILASFAFRELLEDNVSITIVLEEKSSLLPSYFSKRGKVAVLNGFCNPIELQTFPQKGKCTYLRLYRRRWKESGSNIGYSNTYKFHKLDAKVTDPFASFLKETP